MVGSPYVVKCHVCRRRKVKCDGKIPSCSQCLKSNLTCTGYERTLRWNAPKTVLGDLLAIATVEKPPASSRSPLKNSDQGDGRDLNSEEPRLLRRRPKRGPMKTELYLAHSGTQEDLSASQHRLAILGVLQDCWIPTVKQAGASQGTHICSTWLLSACTLSAMKEALPLSNSLLAMSLILLSGGQTDDTLVMESVRHYSQAVQGLKRLVDNELRRDVKEQTRDISLLTCLACASFEMAANLSLGTAYQHYGGIQAIFQQRGVGGLTSQLSRSILYEYRPIDICFCLLDRRASFLSRSAWLNLRCLLQDAQVVGPLQRLLDIAYLVPPIMEQFDSIRTQGSDGSSPPESAPKKRRPSTQNMLSQLLCSTHSVWSELQTWEAGLQNHDESVQLYISRFSSWSNASRDQEEEVYGKIIAVSYSFPSFELGVALIYKAAVEIFVVELMADLKQDIGDRLGGMPVSAAASLNDVGKVDDAVESIVAGTPTEDMLSRSIEDLNQMALDSARRICSAFEYFFEEDKKRIGRMVALFPFETAYRTFKKHASDGDGNDCRRELLFCEMVNEKLHSEGIPTNFQPSST